jgi:hypothetical protein
MGIQITGLDAALLRVPTGTRWAGFGVTTLEVVHVTVTDAEGGPEPGSPSRSVAAPRPWAPWSRA